MVPMSAVTASGTETGSTGAPGTKPTAIIIICSVGGILVSVFLVIIVTGVVRAHRPADRNEDEPLQLARHPQRSLGRGLVTDMLGIMPIVKFEDTKDGGVAAKRDDEGSLGLEDSACERSRGLECIPNAGQPNPQEFEISLTDQQSERRGPTASELNTDAAPNICNFSCPICTESFIRSQDLRVLPCNHQFHPECIHPWLLNVSGTCPLCRFDLNPNQNKESAGRDIENTEHMEETSASAIATPIADNMQNCHSQHHKLKYLRGPVNSWRVYNATAEERLATLHHVREANQGGAAGEEVGERLSRNQSTAQLSNRFRERHIHAGRSRARSLGGTSDIEIRRLILSSEEERMFG